MSIPRDSIVDDPGPRHDQDQRRLRVRRPEAAGPDHRAEHRHPGRRLRRDRVRRLHRRRRRRRRRADLPQAGDEGQARQPRHQEGLPGGRRHRWRSATPAPGTPPGSATSPAPQHQREVVSAVGTKAASPWTVLNPVRYFRLAMAGSQSLRVGEDTGMIATHAVRLGDDPGQRHERADLRGADLRPRGALGPGALQADVQADRRGPHRRHPQEALPRERAARPAEHPVGVPSAGQAHDSSVRRARSSTTAAGRRPPRGPGAAASPPSRAPPAARRTPSPARGRRPPSSASRQ